MKYRRKDVIEVKNDDGTSTQTTEPAVLADVMKEVSQINDSFSAMKNFKEEAMRDLKALRDTVDKSGDKMDAVAAEKVNKLAESVTLRHEELDKRLAEAADTTEKRVTELEVAISRFGTHGGGDTSHDAKDIEDAMEFKRACLSVNKAGDGVIVTSDSVDVDEYRAYKAAFNKHLRKGDDMKHFTAEELKALSVGSDPDGGVLVLPEMSSRIVERIRESSPMRDLATVETIGTDRLRIMEDLDEAGDGWATETASNGETATPQWNRVEIPVHYQEARPRATQQVLDDGSIDLESWLSRKVSRKFGRTEATGFMTGSGVGQPMGCLSYQAWTTNGTYEFNKVEQQNMGHATALTADGIKRVKYRMVEDHMARSTWLMNRLTVMEVFLLKDGEGRYIWREGLLESAPSVLLGLPVRMAADVPVVAANALSVVLGNWSEAYTIVDRNGISVQRDPYTVKPFVEFYTRKRVGGGVVDFQAIKIGKVAA
jgi:HK97 family phage major capsid protein